MSRLSTRLEALRKEHRKALSLFVTAGFPSIGTTVPLVTELAKAGADLIELGIPFSDPIADGPTIQASSQIALQNGITLEKTFAVAKEIRKQCDLPLILMGYMNPIHAYGIQRFVDTCVSTGIDGTIIPDLPLEESEEYRHLAQAKNVATIFLAAPTTSRERLIQLDQISTGFLYCVSITGVTGERQSLASQAETFLKEARSVVKNNPLLVGFGIATPDDAKRVAALSDGIIVGSALVKILLQAKDNHAIDRAVAFVRSLRRALDS